MRRVMVAALLLALLVSALAVSLFANLAAANPVGYSYPKGPPPTPIVEVIELDTVKLALTFSVQAGPWITSYGSQIHAAVYGYEPYHDWGGYSIYLKVFVDGKPWSSLWSSYGGSTKPITVSLKGLSYGRHTLEVTATAIGRFGGKDYSSQGFSGVIEFQIDAPPPSVQIHSLKNMTLNENDFQLALRVTAHTLSWVGYSLDGKGNVTVNQEVLVQGSLTPQAKVWKGNFTLVGLSSGSHSLVVYAKDQTGNSGASITEEFMVEESAVAKEAQAAPLPVAWIAAAIIVAVTFLGLVTYSVIVKRKRSKA